MKTGLIEQIKDSLSCIAYMQREHAAKLVGGRCQSFRPEAKNKTSLMVNERDWYDFGSGIGGDIIDLAAQDKFNGDKGAAIRYLAESCGIEATPQIEITFRSYLKVLDAACDYYQSCLKDQHIQYLRGRGLTLQTIKDLRIGWADNPCEYLKQAGFEMQQIADSGILSFMNRLMIPYLRNGKAVYFIGRASSWPESPSSNAEAKYIKLYRGECSEHPIWGFESLRREGTVIIAEGIFDAISCYQEGYPVITAVTGAFSAEQKKDLLPALQGREVIICMDYDPVTHAGQKFTATLAQELFEAGISVSACFLAGDKNKVDISDLYALNPKRQTLEDIFKKSQKWELVQAEKIGHINSEPDKLRQMSAFLRRCTRCFEWPVVAQLIADIKAMQLFPETWLNELKIKLKQPPSELVIVGDFKQKYDCLYHESLGWYEYQDTRWTSISEYTVRQKIAELYGHHRTSRNVESVYKLLKAELIRRELFNPNKALLNFPNGMFNIESGELAPHSREHYSNIQMTYNYDATAVCPLWEQFIDDVTDGDTQRQMLLQEMFGYCLLRDSRYQKCFCLIGTGANGKSVLLSILEAMIGSANTSHIEIAFLNSEFQRIRLLNSMVNICNDMKTDVCGTEAYFKAIVAGDPINGCLKGKDLVDFRPYCKMVFAANQMLTARDVDNAFMRRICFVNFPIEFVDVPLKSNQKQRDSELTAKLLKELPGIFNWAFNGLKCLREQGCFSGTRDQEQLSRDLLLQSNPIISFVEERIGTGCFADWQQRSAIYKIYTDWCRETNTMPLSARSFWPRLRSVFPFEESRTAGMRLIRFTEPHKYCGESCGDNVPKTS